MLCGGSGNGVFTAWKRAKQGGIEATPVETLEVVVFSPKSLLMQESSPRNVISGRSASAHFLYLGLPFLSSSPSSSLVCLNPFSVFHGSPSLTGWVISPQKILKPSEWKWEFTPVNAT